MKIGSVELTTRKLLAATVGGASAIAVATAILIPPPVTAAGNENTVLIALSSATVAATPDKTDPAQVVGSDSCAKCHKSEVAALAKQKHHGSLAKISGGNASKYIAAVGGSNSLCITCHGTPQGSGDAVKAISSVSCESCHGGAKGWLEIHGKKEVDRADRHAQCDKLGMIRASDVYTIAKNCFNCHVVFNEALVNAGHPLSNKIEFLSWSSGEVRHNFQVDQSKNAEAPSAWMGYAGGNADNRKRVKLVVGHLVDLEVNVRNLATAGADNGKQPFAKGGAKRAKAAAKALEEIAEALGGAAPAELKAALEAWDDIGRVSSINFKSQDGCAKAAPAIAKAAAAFAANNDGSKLAALDELVGDAKARGTAP
jgi:hypothetical protein